MYKGNYKDDQPHYVTITHNGKSRVEFTTYKDIRAKYEP